MGRIKDLGIEGVTDLYSYGVGYENGLYGNLQAAKEALLQILKEEQERTKLGFIQYKRIEELLNDE